MLSTGRLRQGLALLDEAMAAATAGEVRAPEAVGHIYCALLAGCERTVDLEFDSRQEAEGLLAAMRAIWSQAGHQVSANQQARIAEAVEQQEY